MLLPAGPRVVLTVPGSCVERVPSADGRPRSHPILMSYPSDAPGASAKSHRSSKRASHRASGRASAAPAPKSGALRSRTVGATLEPLAATLPLAASPSPLPGQHPPPLQQPQQPATQPSQWPGATQMGAALSFGGPGPRGVDSSWWWPSDLQPPPGAAPAAAVPQKQWEVRYSTQHDNRPYCALTPTAPWPSSPPLHR